MLEIFRLVDVRRRSPKYSGSGGRYDPVYKDAAERVEEAGHRLSGEMQVQEKAFDLAVKMARKSLGVS